MTLQHPTIALIGPGAIGTTIAAMLHETGQNITICGRTSHKLLALHVEEKRITIPGPVLTDPAKIKHPFDLVFVAVKSTQITSIAPWISALCSDKTIVCILQNGVEQKAHFSAYLSEDQILPSVVWFPAQRESATSVRLRGKARLTLPDTAAAHEVINVLRDTECTVDVTTDFLSVAWRKLLQNAVAGLMALTGRRAGMFSRQDITQLGLAYLHECLQVARAEGAILADEVPQTIMDGFHRSPSDLGSSILTDRLAGLPLEWDIRNGVIQRYGLTHHIPTPISDLIVPLLAATSDGPG